MNKNQTIASLQDFIRRLRDQAKLSISNQKVTTSQIIRTEIRQGYLNGQVIDRLVIFLRGTGCSYVRKTGGCTFCGFFNATNLNDKISDESYLKQFQDAIAQFSVLPSIVCLYNDGSLLCEDEMSFCVVKKMLACLENIPEVKKVVLESRVVDLTEEKIIRLRSAFSKNLEIAIGFESANPNIRDFCINKSFSQTTFENAIHYCKEWEVDIIPLMIFKPPFLTEREAIDDYVANMMYLEPFCLKRIDMEILTIQRDTLAYFLWSRHLFRPPRFWSIIEALKIRTQMNLLTPIYISPISYTVRSECLPSNCSSCDQQIFEQFNDYNRCGLISVFDDLECSCKNLWQEEIQRSDNQSIPERVLSFLQMYKSAVAHV